MKSQAFHIEKPEHQLIDLINCPDEWLFHTKIKTQKLTMAKLTEAQKVAIQRKIWIYLNERAKQFGWTYDPEDYLDEMMFPFEHATPEILYPKANPKE